MKSQFSRLYKCIFEKNKQIKRKSNFNFFIFKPNQYLNFEFDLYLPNDWSNHNNKIVYLYYLLFHTSYLINNKLVCRFYFRTFKIVIF